MATRKPDNKKRTILILSILTLFILSIMSWQTFRSTPQLPEGKGIISDNTEQAREELEKIPGGHIEIEGEIGKSQTEVESQPPQQYQTENPEKFSEPVTPVETPIKEPRLHKVEKGETLSSISRHYYGTPNRWQEIYEANRDKMVNKNRIRPGSILVIPDRD